jgi:hypothetical protein
MFNCPVCNNTSSLAHNEYLCKCGFIRIYGPNNRWPEHDNMFVIVIEVHEDDYYGTDEYYEGNLECTYDCDEGKFSFKIWNRDLSIDEEVSSELFISKFEEMVSEQTRIWNMSILIS